MAKYTLSNPNRSVNSIGENYCFTNLIENKVGRKYSKLIFLLTPIYIQLQSNVVNLEQINLINCMTSELIKLR